MVAGKVETVLKCFIKNNDNNNLKQHIHTQRINNIENK